MNHRVCTLTCFHWALWECWSAGAHRPLGGFTAYCFCCNYNRKKDVSAHRNSYCRSSVLKVWELRVREPQSSGGGVEWWRSVDWRPAYPSQWPQTVLLLTGRNSHWVQSFSCLAANRSCHRGGPGKVENTMETKLGVGWVDSPCLLLFLSPGGSMLPEEPP